MEVAQHMSVLLFGTSGILAQTKIAALLSIGALNYSAMLLKNEALEFATCKRL